MPGDTKIPKRYGKIRLDINKQSRLKEMFYLSGGDKHRCIDQSHPLSSDWDSLMGLAGGLFSVFFRYSFSCSALSR